MSQDENVMPEGDAVTLALQAKILERVPQALDDIRNHPFRVGLTHAKILAGALKIEQSRTEEAAVARANSMREQAVMAFDEICGWRGAAQEAPETRTQHAAERAAFLEKLGVKP